MRVTSKGQVTIPQELRERFGLLPDTEVDFVVKGNGLQIVKAEPRGQSRGEKAVALLRGRGKVRMSTDQIMALTRR